jgi:hypothetical protein
LDKLDVSVLLNAVMFNRDTDEKIVVCKNDGNILFNLFKLLIIFLVAVVVA